MSSTFLGLNTAYTGLQAANAALNTTANNISNAETEGFSRQTVTTQAANAIRSFTTYGCVGAGVETLAIERVRDNFYDEKYWTNNTKLGEYESKQYYMSCIEEYYTDDDSIKGFSTIFDEFYAGLAELSKNPGDTTVRQQAIGYAGNLATYFNDMYTNLRKLQDDANQEIKVNIDRINSVTQEIASLNKQINVIEMNTGAMANELRDQRDLLVDELSEIVNVEVTETPIIDANDTSRDTGGTRYMVKICGQSVVDGNNFKALACVPRANDEANNQTDVDGLYDVYFALDDATLDEDRKKVDPYGNPVYGSDAEIYRAKGDALNMYSTTVGGKLGGLVAMRDGNNSEGFTGTVTSVDVPAQKVTVEVGADYLQDLNKLNLTVSGGIINIGNNNYYFDSWTYNYDSATSKVTFEFELDKDKNGTTVVPLSAANKHLEASVGPSVDYQGIPYYLSQMNQWVRMYSSAYNKILQGGVQDNGEPGIKMFTGEFPDGTEYSFSTDIERGNGNLTVKSTDDSYYQLTAGSFKVSDELIADSNKFATREIQYSGKDDNSIIRKLINLKSDTNPETGGMSFRGCSADQYLVCILSDVSLNAQRANEFTDNYKVLRTSIENQRLSVSGVDNDEEAVNLTKFQQQYNMASKVIQTLTEVYDRLILATGV